MDCCCSSVLMPHKSEECHLIKQENTWINMCTTKLLQRMEKDRTLSCFMLFRWPVNA